MYYRNRLAASFSFFRTFSRKTHEQYVDEDTLCRQPSPLIRRTYLIYMDSFSQSFHSPTSPINQAENLPPCNG